MAIRDPQINATLDNIYATNWGLIRDIFPDLFSALDDVPDLRDRLELVGKQDINIRYQGQRLYPTTDVAGYIRKQYEAFRRKPVGIEHPPARADPDRPGPHCDLLRRLEAVSPVVSGGRVAHKSYKFPDDHLPLVIVLGMGAGYHLEHLLSEFRVHNLIIVEDSPEMLKTSLYLANWGRILRPILAQGTVTNFSWGDTADQVVADIQGAASRHNPVFVSGSLIYEHYKSAFFDAVYAKLSEKVGLSFQGWGFYDDEYNTIKQTLASEAQRLPILQAKPATQPQAPAFLIANGPSLDRALPAIASYQDQAVIFSGGTAIGPLHEWGIRPDFHVEMERGSRKYRALAEDVPEGFLSGLDFIGPSRLHPAVFGLFGAPHVYVKGMDSGGSLYPEDVFRMQTENPTVANAMMAVALDLGFKELVLFGMDMGVREEEGAHHSRFSLYYKAGSLLSNREFRYPKRVEANLGGDAYTHGTLFWSKTNLEARLARAEGVTATNISDGVRITGACPRAPEQGLPELALSGAKDEARARVKAAFTADRDALIGPERLHAAIAHTREVADELERLAGGPVTSRAAVLERFARMHDYMRAEVAAKDGVVFYAFRGSVLEAQKILFTHAFSCPSEEAAVRFLNRGLGILREFFVFAANELEALLWAGLVALEADPDRVFSALPAGPAPFRADTGWQSIEE